MGRSASHCNSMIHLTSTSWIKGLRKVKDSDSSADQH